jgi:hypothetical protein
MLVALKDLVLVIKDLPQFALWILGGFLFYKLFVVGSIYGVIRLAINRLYEYLTHPKPPVETIVKYDIDKIAIRDHNITAKVIFILERIRGSGPYLHSYHINWLEDAIEAKIKADGLPDCSKNSDRKVHP